MPSAKTCHLRTPRPWPLQRSPPQLGRQHRHLISKADRDGQVTPTPSPAGLQGSMQPARDLPVDRIIEIETIQGMSDVHRCRSFMRTCTNENGRPDAKPGRPMDRTGIRGRIRPQQRAPTCPTRTPRRSHPRQYRKCRSPHPVHRVRQSRAPSGGADATRRH